MATLFMESSFVRRLYYKIEDLIKPPGKLPPDKERSEVEFSPESDTISVEMALNSRCTSDSDGNPKRFHWGMFDVTRKLSEDQIEMIIARARIPRFTKQKVEIQSDHNIQTFLVDNLPPSIHRDWMMVESGMQQQAVGLVCAALGVGMVFRSLGDDGAPISDMDYASIMVKLDAMKPSYDGLFWVSSQPEGWKPWLR